MKRTKEVLSVATAGFIALVFAIFAFILQLAFYGAIIAGIVWVVKTVWFN